MPVTTKTKSTKNKINSDTTVFSTKHLIKIILVITVLHCIVYFAILYLVRNSIAVK